MRSGRRVDSGGASLICSTFFKRNKKLAYQICVYRQQCVCVINALLYYSFVVIQHTMIGDWEKKPLGFSIGHQQTRQTK